MDDKKNVFDESKVADTAIETKIEPAEESDDDVVVVFKKPYTFEGKEYTQINLSGMEDMDAKDFIAVNKQFARANEGTSVMPEFSPEFALMFAARATKLPIEFFYGLPVKEVIRIKNRVSNFFFV